MARRPTGGGIIFHLFDLAFSVLVPAGHPSFSKNTLDNYAFVNRAVEKAVKALLNEKDSSHLLATDPIAEDKRAASFCMAKPTIYDVMIGDRKIAGAAQRRKKQGYLHQGSIAIAPPDLDYLREILIKSDKVVEAMSHQSFSMLPQDYTQSDLASMRFELNQQLKKSFVEENL